MDELTRYALCVQAADGQLVPVISGNVNHLGLYRLVVQLSDMRQLFPQFLLVVEGHVVSYATLTREGMSLKGQPVMEG